MQMKSCLNIQEFWRTDLICGDMRCNGTLRYMLGCQDGSSSDEPYWSEEIPCNIKTDTDNKLWQYEDGEAHQQSFTILIELERFPYSRIRLERYGEPLGEYRVTSTEPLVTVGRTIIHV